MTKINPKDIPDNFVERLKAINEPLIDGIQKDPAKTYNSKKGGRQSQHEGIDSHAHVEGRPLRKTES